MSAQSDSEFLVQRARELVPQDLWAAKAWLITARSLYPADFNIQVRSGPARPPAWRCELRARPPRPSHSSPPPAQRAARSTPLRGGAHWRSRWLGRGAAWCGSEAAQFGFAPGRPLSHSFIPAAAICSASLTFEMLSQ